MMVTLACQCAVTMQTNLHDYQVKEGVLKVHSGIGVGKLWGLHVGGVDNRLEYLIAGMQTNRGVSVLTFR